VDNVLEKIGRILDAVITQHCNGEVTVPATPDGDAVQDGCVGISYTNDELLLKHFDTIEAAQAWNVERLSHHTPATTSDYTSDAELDALISAAIQTT